jgi:hypothetical protein
MALPHKQTFCQNLAALWVRKQFLAERMKYFEGEEQQQRKDCTRRYLPTLLNCKLSVDCQLGSIETGSSS